MTNRTKSNSVQTWVTETVNHHRQHMPWFVLGSHLLTAQKHANECHVIERLIGAIAQRPVYYALLDVVGGCAPSGTGQNLR